MKRIILLFVILLIVLPNITFGANIDLILKENQDSPFLLMADLESQGKESASTTVTLVARSQAMDDMLLFFEEADLIVTATKHPQKISEAPAIATVITAEQIRNMGARDIIDILRLVPGIGVTKGYYGKEEIEVRGIKTTNSEKVKLLIDGYSVNDNASGGAVWVFDSLAVDNIKRIEIIRGPGSALYGSNAFSAVINVVTKNGEDIDGTIVTVGGGSFDSQKVNLQTGNKWDNLDVAFTLDYFETDGAELDIESDAFLQPGKTKDFEDKIEASLNVIFKDFSFNSKYISRKKGDYIGLTYSALTDDSEVDLEQYFGEAGYKHSLNDSINLTGTAYIDSLDWDAYWELLPEGTPGFPEGMIGNPSFRERTLGAEVQLDYELSDDNMITMGALKEERKQSEVAYKANYDPRFNTPLPSGMVEDVAGFANWNENKTRDIWAAYFQDVWDVKENINLTLGVRHDDYSDFGSTTNPRAGLVWNFLENWDVKFLYGSAFRAPSFEELYNKNNLVVVGNKNLKPEKMTTYEVSLGHSYGEHSTARATYFNNRFKDKIQLVGAQFQNTGGARVWGIDVEWEQRLSKETYAYLNYTYQKPEDRVTGDRIADVPSHRGNIGFNYGIGKYLNVNTNLLLSGKRPRATGDTRSQAPAFALVDLTLIAKEFSKNLEIRGAVHNLLDKEYADPAPAGTVSNDFPREGIHFMLEATYKF